MREMRATVTETGSPADGLDPQGHQDQHGNDQGQDIPDVDNRLDDGRSFRLLQGIILALKISSGPARVAVFFWRRPI